MPHRIVLPLSLSLLAAPLLASEAPIPIPMAEKRPLIHNEHHVPRPDDYHWLKQRDDPAVRKYLEAENAYAESWFTPLKPLEQKLLTELRARVVDEDISVPVRRGSYLYYTRFPAGKDYEAICRKPFPDGPEEVLVDHNQFASANAKEGDTYLYGSATVSPDDRYIAWKENHDGADVFTLRIRDLKTGQMLPDEIPGTAFQMPPVWANDSRTLFYTEPDDTQRSFRLKRHALGQPIADAVTLYEEADTRFDLRTYPTTDRQYLVIAIGSSDSSETRLIPLDQPRQQPEVFAPRQPGIRYGIAHHEKTWYIVSNAYGSTNGQLYRTSDTDTAPTNWQPVWPYDESVSLESIDAFATHLVVTAREKGIPGMYLVSPANPPGDRRWVNAPVPGASFYTDDTPEYTSTTQRITYETFLTPYTIADVTLADGKIQILKQKTVPSGFDPDRYEVQHTAATAKDGVPIPIWLVLPKNKSRPANTNTDTPNSIPIVLEGYGSYGSSNDPSFSASQLSLLDRGIGIAITQLRGGGEFGRTWHEAGKVLNKETTLTDYLACADHLIKLGITRPGLIIGYGVSAGGLVAGYSINHRPELFAAFIADVPFVDALNTQFDDTLPLVTGEYEEWGNPAQRAAFDVLRTYVPYENIHRQAYPPLLVTAGWNDPRVMYWEPAKWVAKLRANNTGKAPILLLTQFDSGHGGTSGRYGYLHDVARRYAFILQVLGKA